MRRLWIISVLLLASCSVTRRLPEGTFLLTKVHIDADKTPPRKERIDAAQLNKYVRQSPNKRLLGTNFYVWVYQHANPEKNNWWNRLKRRIGQEPVLLDMALTEQSRQNLKSYLDYKGYYRSQATFEVDTVRRPRKARVTYHTVQGEPYRVRNIDYEFRDQFLEQLILPDTNKRLIRRGKIFDMSVLDEERKRIVEQLRDRGYYDFAVTNVSYIADTLPGDRQVDLTMVIKQHLAGNDENGDPIWENNAVFQIDTVTVFPGYDPTMAVVSGYREPLDTTYYMGLNVVYPRRLGRPHVRPAVLRKMIPLQPNLDYDARTVRRTYDQLMGIGYFRSANIRFTIKPDSIASNDVMFVGDGMRGTGDFTPVSTHQRVMRCDIHGIPALRQGYKIELEGSYTSAFWGLRTTVGYQNRNVFRGAESFDAAVTLGYEYYTRAQSRRHATEIGVTMGLSFPRFLVPFRIRRPWQIQQARTRLEFGINFQNRPNYDRNLSSVSWGYSWNDHKYSSFTFRPVDINVIDVRWIDEDFRNGLRNEYLRQSYESQLVPGLSFGYVFNNQRRTPGGSATMIRANFETAGNLVHGLAHAFWKPAPDATERYYNIFGLRYSQYVRADVSASRKVMLGEVTALAFRLYGGYSVGYGNANSVPFDRQFYAGGANSMRGWSPRTLGPGGTPRPVDEKGKPIEDIFPSQTGDMKLEANIEFRFPIWKMLHGGVFLDAGNVWFADAASAPVPEAVFHPGTFIGQTALNTGIGLRLDVKFVVIRLDWGIQLHNPNRSAGDRWFHSFAWRDTALNFGVGYPF